MDEMRENKLYLCHYDGDWRRSVFSLLDASGLESGLKANKRVLIKPNLVEALRPPVTTPVALVGAIVDYLQERLPGAEIIVCEGTGAADYDTSHAFEELGYEELARKKSIKLVDLNVEPLVKLSNPSLSRWPTIYLPRIVMESFLISVPVLKAHSLSCVTLTMKNMMGAAPPVHYQAGGHWKKSAFHERMQESILDVGMAEAHLWGPACDPHPGVLAAGFDPVALDAYGAGLLKRDWRTIDHISLANGEIGSAEPLKIEDAVS
jgi:uncharacterized protein (DUF362 family)